MISRSWAPTTTEVADVGGKGASLFQLVSLGCQVPRFFVITTAAMRAHADGQLSAELRQATVEAWRELGGEDHAVAVRSSGVAEDSAENSFAGVFDTILGVRDADALAEAVERCWASRLSVAADAYRGARGAEGDTGIAVAVQRMVDADWAGVCFTADPVTQALSVTAVNVVRGIGEALVSGVAAPEEIRINTRSGEVLERRAAPGQAPFPEALLAAVVAESTRVAEALGFPQDLEWAFEGKSLHLLQSRPITTLTATWANRALEPWGDEARPDDPARVWTRAYADEIWTPPVSPLFYDLQNLTGQIALQLRTHGDNGPLPLDVFKYHRAAPYLDAAPLERIYAFQPRWMRSSHLLNALPPERREAVRRAPWKWSGLARRTWFCEITHGPRRGFTRNHRFLDSAWAPFEQAVTRLLAVDESALTDEALDQHLMAVWTVAGTIGADCGIAVFYYAHDLRLLITALLERWCGDGGALYGGVSGGLAASVTVQEADAIWEMARQVRDAGPEARAAAQRSTWAEFSGQADAPTKAAFEAFRASHGHRGANYKDPIHPRWGDDPELLWRQVQAYLGSDYVRPGQANAASAGARAKAQRDILAGLRGPLAGPRRGLLRFLFKYNEIYMGHRDGHRFYYDYIWWLLRRVYTEKGRRLHAAGRLAQPADVFFLVRSEIAALAGGGLDPATAARRIEVRRAEWEVTRREQPPKFLRRGCVPDGEPDVAGSDAHSLAGTAASAGQVRGRARVIYDVAELGRLEKGDILVTRQTDPAWTPTFARLGGLVLETGGVLAHGASLCREFNVPCVTAVEQATIRIGDGDWVLVDGGQGVVRILEPAPHNQPELAPAT
jgi:pyruvate,water dikinase